MKKYWFKNKSYGYGWQPASWQGWVVLGFFGAAAALVSMQVLDEPTNREMIIFSAEIILLVFLLLVVCIHKGEKPEWRWRGKPIRKEKELNKLDKSPNNSYDKNS